MIPIIVCGAAGRMGRRIIACAMADPEFKIVGAVELPQSPHLGKDAGEVAGEGTLSLKITANLAEVLPKGDAVIDFTHPASTLSNLKTAAEHKKAMVIGTTGLSDAQKKEVENLARQVPVVLSPNMSVGVNLLFEIVGEVARKLGSDYDIEIVEAHHRFKKDAPSGTAKRLAEIIAEATGRSLAKDAVYGRKGDSTERKKNEIGIHAVRAGDIVGDHTVTFCTLGERVEISHRAHSRDTFAKGALRAVRFIVGQKPGLYNMQGVLKGK